MWTSSFSVLISLAVLPFVAAQDAALGIKAIEAHFQQSHIVEDYFKTFAPTALLGVEYTGVGAITPGQKLTIPQVRPKPTLTVTPGAANADLTGAYTLAMIDIDFVGADTSTGVTRHWLVNGLTINDGVLSNGTTSTVITDYAGPGPAPNSGSHRYIFALYSQPADFAPPTGFTGPLPVAKYDFLNYVEASNLGPLVAANYINVEEGTFTGSAVPTSAVVSSTLAPAAASGKPSVASGSKSPSGTGTKGPEPSETDGAARVAVPVLALVGGLFALAL